jgi:hypothetical protein
MGIGNGHLIPDIYANVSELHEMVRKIENDYDSKFSKIEQDLEWIKLLLTSKGNEKNV